MKKNSPFLLYLPMILVEVYLIFTILLYQFGPLNWQTENEGMFWFFLLMYHIAFVVGYVISIKKIHLKPSKWHIDQLSDKTFRIAIWGVLAVCAVCACIEYKNLTHASTYIPYELPKDFIAGLTDPASQYYNKFSAEGQVGNKLVTAISALFSFIYLSLIPLLIIQWKRFSLPQKAVALFIIIFKTVVYVSIGTNKGIFDTMFNFGGTLLVLVLLNVFHKTDAHITKSTFIKVAAFTLFLICFSFWYFTVNISSRVESPIDYAISVSGQKPSSSHNKDHSGDEGSEGLGWEYDSELDDDTNEYADENTVPDSFINRMLYSVSNYLCQGYYGMSLSLDEEFTSTYGIGNSQFLMSNFKSLFGIDVKDRTYQHKIDDKWDEDGKWHSFYSYIANDVSFYGVILVMLLLGLFFGCICKDVFLNNSLIGKLMLPIFVILFMYMPANNQVFTAMATFTAFAEFSVLWLLSKLSFKRLGNEQ